MFVDSLIWIFRLKRDFCRACSRTGIPYILERLETQSRFTIRFHNKSGSVEMWLYDFYFMTTLKIIKFS